MKPVSEMSQLEIAAYVQSHLLNKGIQVVLSGGAAASYFCRNQYVSYDIDLVNSNLVNRRKIQRAMFEIGFYEEGRYFKHSDSSFFVEFPPGPLTVGMEPVAIVEEIPLQTGVLRIISATDCVKDRLSAFYHWNDRPCLMQAVLVRDSAKVDLEEIKRWSINEGKEKGFQEFLSARSESM